jgi:hypothetical protein
MSHSASYGATSTAAASRLLVGTIRGVLHGGM